MSPLGCNGEIGDYYISYPIYENRINDDMSRAYKDKTTALKKKKKNSNSLRINRFYTINSLCIKKLI